MGVVRLFLRDMVGVFIGLLKTQVFFFDKLKSKGFLASGVSTCGFSALYAALPHNLIKGKQTELVGGALGRGGSFCLACGDGHALFASGGQKD